MSFKLARGWKFAGLGLLSALILLGLCEALAWPFLARPAQEFLSRKLDRPVAFSPAFGVRFLGGVRLHVDSLEIAAPSWSSAPHLLQASAVTVHLRYLDLWRFYRGEPSLRIELLRADQLDAQLERLADGRASWQFSVPTSAAAVAAPPPPLLPRFGRVEAAHGQLLLRDQLLGADVTATLSLVQGQTPQLQVAATGQYRRLPVKIDLLASGALPLLVGDEVGTVIAPAVPAAASAASRPAAAAASRIGLQLTATVGRASLKFDGDVADALSLQRLTGRFHLAGPSLAAVGDPLGVTLPTTAAFRSEGRLTRQGGRWQVEVDEATIGRSQLTGSFVFDGERPTPLLSGRLGGARLDLIDLGPAFGTPTDAATAKVGKAKVLPTRPFDLVALRAMDADVRVDIAELNLHTTLLEPLRPLRGHLVLTGGVLTLSELDARTADGNLRGEIGLDGRQATALWHADLRWADVRLERWIHQTPVAGAMASANTAPPWVSGRLKGHAVLTGQGISTADILASMKGSARTELHGGTVSHLAIEEAGLDVAQALGVLIKGDDALPVNCGVADLAVAAGVVRPRVLVLDTSDSALWVTGSVSLASEQMDLRAVVAPKDFSPLALRTPLHVGGSFAAPSVALEKGPLARKLGGAALLALINPFAALIPLIDIGDTEGAQQAAAGCERLMQSLKPRFVRQRTELRKSAG